MLGYPSSKYAGNRVEIHLSLGDPRTFVARGSPQGQEGKVEGRAALEHVFLLCRVMDKPFPEFQAPWPRTSHTGQTPRAVVPS